mgnify:CR=1 FL=1
MASLRERIIKVLIEDKLISRVDLEQALKSQKENGGQLSQILVKSGFIEENTLLAAMSKVFDKPSIDISRFKIDPAVLKMVPLNICRQYQVIPISHLGDTMTLAMADPLNILALDDVKGFTGYNINPIIADSRRIAQAIEHYYSEASSKSAIDDLIRGTEPEDIELVRFQDEGEALSLEDLGRLSRQGPVINFVNQLFEQAVALKASDILIEPQEYKLRVRLRVDGMLREQPENNKNMGPLVASRIKVVSGLDIAEHRLPQDGRLKMTLSGREVDFRVSVMPSIFGEKVVIRVLDKGQLNLDVEKLGFQEKAISELKRSVLKPYGMILACGPTGAGKTTTLYSLLKLVDRPRVNIITVEDPVEFQLPGINQVNVQPEIGLSFAAVLRSVLRQDPNVIMVGEIRDSETVDIAVKAALTGHLVLSTLHTITAAGAVVRMSDMGVEPFLINSALNCILAQRLVRILCAHCKERYELKEETVRKIGLKKAEGLAYDFFRPKGCSKCSNSGYKGRVVLAEVLALSPAIKELVLKKSPEQAIKQQARREGMQTLREDGILKAGSGRTSLEEVLRVTAQDE